MLTSSIVRAFVRADDDDFKRNGFVNGAGGKIVEVVLDPREPEDDGKGEFRELQYPPVYIVFQPKLEAPHPAFADPKFPDRTVPAGAFVLKPRNFQFQWEPKVGRRNARTHGLAMGSGKRLKLGVKRLKGYRMMQDYAGTDVSSQGSTYTENLLVDVRRYLKIQSWYIMFSRAKDPSKVALLTPITKTMLMKFAKLIDGGEEMKKVSKTTRDILPEVRRLKRCAERTRAAFPPGGLRAVDPVWFDAETAGMAARAAARAEKRRAAASAATSPTTGGARPPTPPSAAAAASGSAPHPSSPARRRSASSPPPTLSPTRKKLRARKKRTACKCGSGLHLNTSHGDCPLNPAKTTRRSHKRRPSPAEGRRGKEGRRCKKRGGA